VAVVVFDKLQTMVDRWVVSRAHRKPLTDPVLAHIHVPKCGGTAFRSFLVEYFGANHLALYVPDTFHVYSEADLAELIRDRSVRGFSSHFVRTFPEQVAGRDLLYITFLRNPVEQFVSYITYIKKNFHNIQDDTTLIRSLPPDAASLPVREIARWILTCDREVNFRENYTVNFFSRFVVPGEPGHFRMDPFFLKQRLATAKSLLARFFFVGVSDQMERSNTVLRKLIAKVGVDFPEGEVPIENTSAEFRGDLSWIEPSDEVGALLLNSLREDQQLYSFALRRLAALEGFVAKAA
jgi:hypothetical protein